MSLGIPLGRFGAAMGLIPYSSLGYKIENISSDGIENSKRFNGWGGLNRVFIGTGYRITQNLNIHSTKINPKDQQSWLGNYQIRSR